MNLSRYKNPSDVQDVYNFISDQVQKSGRQHGYRFMHLKCKLAGLVVSRQTVVDVMQVLDPEGIQLRRRRKLIRRRYYGLGPNFIWHCDGYDKLKPYGIAISGCIDGYSRYIIWMQAYYTNNDPKIIADYFMSSVQKLGGCPRIVRIDEGTENVNISVLQQECSQYYWGEELSYCVLKGKSTSNQRIESWWNQYRRQNSEYYIELFQRLTMEGNFCGDEVDKELIRFCFLQIIQVCWTIIYCQENFYRIALLCSLFCSKEA